MIDGIYHFVRHHEVEAFERLGWQRHDALDGTHHGVWSCLMVWAGEGEPVKPLKIVKHETNRFSQESQMAEINQNI